MATSTSPGPGSPRPGSEGSAFLDAPAPRVRGRARRLGRPTQPPRRFDHFGLGVLAVLLFDLVGVIWLVLAHDLPLGFVVLFGPFSLAGMPGVWLASLLLLVAACATGRWRFLAGALLVLVGQVLLAFVWPLMLGAGRFLPM